VTRDINLATWTTHVSLRNESKSELPGGADTLRSLVNAASGRSRRPGGLNWMWYASNRLEAETPSEGRLRENDRPH
jgi:hypothetical protein